jgi:hypothetical protein
MRMLTEMDFIELWETGRSLHPLDQAILAIHTAFPEITDSIADWPIGQRNRVLAKLRCDALGGSFRGWSACPVCGEKLEFELDGRGLASGSEAGSASDACVDGQGQRYRLPTSRDLAAVSKEPNAIAAARRLLQRCCVNMDVARSPWSEEEIDEIGELMAAADPLAEIRMSFECPICKAAFEESVDLPTFLWAELEARAKRTLSDVHRLASAYGWSQAEILGLSTARREFYLNMVHA